MFVVDEQKAAFTRPNLPEKTVMKTGLYKSPTDILKLKGYCKKRKLFKRSFKSLYLYLVAFYKFNLIAYSHKVHFQLFLPFFFSNEKRTFSNEITKKRCFSKLRQEQKSKRTMKSFPINYRN
jgi:hypothetical protein